LAGEKDHLAGAADGDMGVSGRRKSQHRQDVGF
jgi:hypothetical protein